MKIWLGDDVRAGGTGWLVAGHGGRGKLDRVRLRLLRDATAPAGGRTFAKLARPCAGPKGLRVRRNNDSRPALSQPSFYDQK